ncbi:P-loop containing nucleoside triphosphate hydrolase protein, partial [Tuber borchii]
VEFRGVEFRYTARPDVLALESVSCTIEPDPFVAFFGYYSGTIKSSTVALLERFYNANSGSILINDMDIRAIPVCELRSWIPFVSQESCVFSGSIHFKVGLGLVSGKEVSRNVVESVCKMCRLYNFIIGLPKGYELYIYLLMLILNLFVTKSFL